MYLLITTTFLSFLSASTSTLTKPIINWLNKPTSKEKEMYREIAELQQEQSKLSMVDNFAAHAKLQRKINNIKMNLSNKSSDQVQKYINQFSITVGAKFIIGLIMIYILIMYRYVPVYVFPKYYSFYPLDRIMSYPNDVPGSVSTHFWLIVCNSVARKIIK